MQNKVLSLKISSESQHSELPVLLLCDFCERDGPSILFSTTIWDLKDCSLPKSQDNGEIPIDKLFVHLMQNTESEAHLPNKISIQVEQLNDDSLIANNKNVDRSTKLKNIILLGDCSYNVFYSYKGHYIFRSHFSLPFTKPETIAKYNQICLRSLSGEHVGPGREGACIFGNSLQGYTFNFVFNIKDIKARGQIRWMSFCLISMKLSDLAMNWSFLNKVIKQLIKSIKRRASQIYFAEQRKVEAEIESLRLARNQTSSHSLVSSEDIQSNYMHTNRLSSRHEVLHRIGIHSSKRGHEKLRTLPDLLLSNDFFKELHANLCITLFAYLNRFTRYDSKVNHSSTNLHTHLLLRKYSFLSFYNNLKKLVSDYKRVLEWIVYHVLTGDQIILRGNNIVCLHSIMSAFVDLVPKDSIRFPKEECQKCLPSYQANFLVLHSSVKLQFSKEDCIDPRSTVVLDVESQYNDNGTPMITFLKPLITYPENLPKSNIVSLYSKLAQTSKTDSIFQSRLDVYKHQLLSRAKIYLQVFRQNEHPSQQKDAEQLFLNQYGYTHADVKVLKNFLTGQVKHQVKHAQATSSHGYNQ